MVTLKRMSQDPSPRGAQPHAVDLPLDERIGKVAAEGANGIGQPKPPIPECHPAKDRVHDGRAYAKREDHEPEWWAIGGDEKETPDGRQQQSSDFEGEMKSVTEVRGCAWEHEPEFRLRRPDKALGEENERADAEQP
jgi:hypothetical protein